MHIYSINTTNKNRPHFGKLKGVIIGKDYKSFIENKDVQRTLKAINSNKFFDKLFQSKNGYITIDAQKTSHRQYSADSYHVLKYSLGIFFEPEKQNFFSKLLNAGRTHKKFDLIEESDIDCAWDGLAINEYNLKNRFLSKIRNYNEYDFDNFVREIKNGNMDFEDRFARARKAHKTISGYKGYRTSDEMVEDVLAQFRKVHEDINFDQKDKFGASLIEEKRTLNDAFRKHFIVKTQFLYENTIKTSTQKAAFWEKLLAKNNIYQDILKNGDCRLPVRYSDVKNILKLIKQNIAYLFMINSQKENSKILKKAYDKTGTINSENIKKLFDNLNNKESTLVTYSELLKDKNGVIQEKNLHLLENLIEKIQYNVRSFDNFKNFRDSEGNINPGFCNNFCKLMDKYGSDINASLILIRSMFFAENKQKVVDYAIVDAIYPLMKEFLTNICKKDETIDPYLKEQILLCLKWTAKDNKGKINLEQIKSFMNIISETPLKESDNDRQTVINGLINITDKIIDENPSLFSAPVEFIKKINCSPESKLGILNKLSANPKTSAILVKTLSENPKESQRLKESILNILGGDEKAKEYFNKWYHDEQTGYKHAYFEYYNNMYDNAKDLMTIVKQSPNLAPWAFLNKAKELGGEPTLGKLPKGFGSLEEFRLFMQELVKFNKEINSTQFKKQTPNYKDVQYYITINDKQYKVEKLRGGMSAKTKYKVSPKNGDTYIIKFNAYDAIGNTWRSTQIRENQAMRGDSPYLDAMIDFYLKENKCNNAADVQFFDYKSKAVVYNVTNGIQPDFEQGLFNNLYIFNNSKLGEKVRSLGIVLNDINDGNFLKDNDGKYILIDTGHAEYNQPFRPMVPGKHISLSNLCGRDLK